VISKISEAHEGEAAATSTITAEIAWAGQATANAPRRQTTAERAAWAPPGGSRARRADAARSRGVEALEQRVAGG